MDNSEKTENLERTFMYKSLYCANFSTDRLDQ